MCMPAECETCTTWRGCGKHVDRVMANVPEAQQCKCPEGERKPKVSRT